MLGNFIIGLREGLEASLIVGILVAYLVKVGRREHLPKIWIGVGVAVAVSLGFGALLTFGPRGLTPRTQEIIEGGLSLLAVALVTSMILWMAQVGRRLVAGIHQQVDAAAGAPWSLALIAAISVGREGLETALFLWAATAASSSEGAVWPLVGAVLGLVLAVALGYLVYAGAVRINLRAFFAATGGFLILVAAGVLSSGVHELQEAGVAPGEHDIAYDISAVVGPASPLGTALKAVFNFSPAPTVLQVTAWTLYGGIVGLWFVRRTLGTSGASPARV